MNQNVRQNHNFDLMIALEEKSVDQVINNLMVAPEDTSDVH